MRENLDKLFLYCVIRRNTKAIFWGCTYKVSKLDCSIKMIKIAKQASTAMKNYNFIYPHDKWKCLKNVNLKTWAHDEVHKQIHDFIFRPWSYRKSRCTNMIFLRVDFHCTNFNEFSPIFIMSVNSYTRKKWGPWRLCFFASTLYCKSLNFSQCL